MGGGTEREQVLFQIAEAAVEALRLADLYLDGFVWVTEPEFSELEAIKGASERAQKMLDEVRGAVVKPSVTLGSDDWEAAGRTPAEPRTTTSHSEPSDV
jgi:hypothetical protein